MQQTSDAAVQQHHQVLEEVALSPYFRGFQPRAYPAWAQRHKNPRAFLEQVGIEKIGELVQHGLSFGEISALLDISTRVMRKWMQEDIERLREVEEARRFAADEERVEARRIADDVQAYPDTARAKLMVDVRLWTAERWDKELYGKSLKVDASLTSKSISYVFNVGVPAVKQVLEGAFEAVDRLPAPEEAAFTALLPSLDFSEDET
jgi:hypothetical protein